MLERQDLFNLINAVYSTESQVGRLPARGRSRMRSPAATAAASSSISPPPVLGVAERWWRRQTLVEVMATGLMSALDPQKTGKVGPTTGRGANPP